MNYCIFDQISLRIIFYIILGTCVAAGKQRIYSIHYSTIQYDRNVSSDETKQYIEKIT